MASINKRQTKSKRYNYSITFYLNHKRKTLALGSSYSEKSVQTICSMTQEIVNAIMANEEPKKYVQTFLQDMAPDLRKRFERARLIEPSKDITISQLWELFLQDQGNRMDSTMRTYETARKRFLGFFPPDKNPRDITENDCRAFRDYLKKKYAEATVAGTLQRSKAVVKWAIKEEYMDIDPFAHIPRGSFINKDREFFVPMSYYFKLLDACPDQTWRTILALCRIGGLRNPSETLLLKWSDVNWEKKSLLVHSPKTERYDGKKSRIIPLFPLLRIELEKQFEEAVPEVEGGSPYIIHKWREKESNMRTHFERIIFNAGLVKWERLFQNLRGSRSNELFAQYPDYVASTWMGHRKDVAFNHYLHVTDDDFNKALQENPPTMPPSGPTDMMGTKEFNR